jgi:hypothetical protein
MIKKIFKSNIGLKTKHALKAMLEDWSYQEFIDVGNSSYPTGVIERFMEITEDLSKKIKNIKDFPTLCILENTDGDENYMDGAYNIAKLYAFKKLTKKEAKSLDKKIWKEGYIAELKTRCYVCLNKNKINTKCKEYVKRVVGECEGSTGKNQYQLLEEKIKEVAKGC